MRSVSRNLPFAILTTAFVLVMTACGISNPAFLAGTDSATVLITLTGPGTVTLGEQSQYAATVTGSADATVTWSVNGVAGGNSAVGSISANGLYKAPGSAPQSATVTITAASAASPAVSKSLPVALAAPPPQPIDQGQDITLAIAGPTSLTLGSSSAYVASITGSSNTAVSWSVNGVAGGDAADGVISATGVYTAPVTAPEDSEVTIEAVSAADPSVSGGITVTLTAAPLAPGWNPDGSGITLLLSGATTVTLATSAQYTATVTGSTDTSVAWTVNGIAGGNSTVGTISSSGYYTAPSKQTSSRKVTIAATSNADSSVSQTLDIALVTPQPPDGGGSGSHVTLTVSGAAAVTLGTSSQYTATISGSTNAAVIWNVNGVVGGNSSFGTISSKGRYTAPAEQPDSPQVSITATSVADPSVSSGLDVALTAPVNPPGGGGSNVSVALNGPTTITLAGSSKYTAVVTGTTNTGVMWSVNGIAGGNSSVGTISNSGRYTAPAKHSVPAKVTITGTSLADPSVTSSLAVTLVAPQPIVTLTLSGPTTVTLGTSSQYSAVVGGSNNVGVIWTVNGHIGGNSKVGAISSKGRYTAPTQQSSPSQVTITATSSADPSVAESLIVALVAPPSGPGGNGGGSTVTLALSGATTVTLGNTAQYTAIVTGNKDTAVVWSVNGVTGGDTTVGKISTKGLYAAPANQPQSSKITITATSMADSSVSQDLVVTLAPQSQPSITVTLSGQTSVTLATTAQYTAVVTGSADTSVTWSVDGLVGGDDSVGTISSTGLYTAPATAPATPKVTITATSVADSSVSQTMTVTLAAPPPNVTLTLSGATKVTLGTSSQYTAVVTGSNNTGVSWTVNGVVGGNATDGVISTAGLYTAPSTAPQPSTVTIAATSSADPTVAKSIVVTLVAPVGNSRIPANAIKSADLNASSNWQWRHDPGTPGTSNGTTSYAVGGLSADDAAREFYMTFTSGGGEIYHVSFAKDTTSTHFVYDANVYVVTPSQLKNLEMDMNAVMSNGETVILATQCSGYSKSWEYTLRSGTGYHWNPSNIPCDPQQWTANTWHHIQIASHRDSSGNAYYDWIGFDGKYTDFQNASGPNAKDLGWAVGSLLINFQIDGPSKTSGSNTLYTDKLFVWRW